MAVRLGPLVDFVNGAVGVDKVGHPAGAFVLPAHELRLCLPERRCIHAWFGGLFNANFPLPVTNTLIVKTDPFEE